MNAQFLIVGDSSELPTLRGWIARLPVDAYGQIFVEVASPVQIEHWHTPIGMSLTWLCRDRGTVTPRGELAARATRAWVDEWLPDDRGEQFGPVVLWIGCSTSSAVNRLCSEIGSRLHLHTYAHPHHRPTPTEGIE